MKTFGMLVWIGTQSLLLGLGARAAHAIPEAGYTEAYAAKVAPYFASGTDGTFQGVGGVTLAYRKFEVPAERENAAIVLVIGKGESLLKYAELVYDLNELSGGRSSIYVYDHRGQGLSQRLLKDPQKQYVRKFSHYVDDLDIFVNQVVRARPHHRLLLIGHSMGGAVSALYLERNPAVFARAVLSAPMLEIDTGNYPEPVAYAIAAGATLAGQGAAYALGQGPYSEAGSKFADNTLTHSEPRYDAWFDPQLSHPEIIIGGATYRWLKESFEADWRALAGASRVRAPVLLLQAGEDHYVRPGGEDRFCAALASRCSKRAYPGSFHGILMEKDAIRDAALAEVARFLKLAGVND